MSARQQILEAGPPEVAKLEGEKAARFKASTMLIPSPTQVQDAILTIPLGQAKTLKDLREQLATEAGADVTCPYAAGVCWRLVAQAAEEDRDEGKTNIAPWWRVTKDKKPNAKLPGGEERHRELLRSEGISI